MEAYAEDLIYCVINWVQTFIVMLSGGLLQTEVCSLADGNKRSWPHAVFQQNIQGFFVQEAQFPPELCWNYMVHVRLANLPILKHLQGSHQSLSFFTVTAKLFK